MSDKAGTRVDVAEVNRRLVAWLEEILGIDGVTLDDDALALGADSVTIMTVLGRLHDELGIEVPVDRFFTASRIGDIVDQALLAEYTQPPERG